MSACRMLIFQGMVLIMGSMTSACGGDGDGGGVDVVDVASDSAGVDWETLRRSAVVAPNGSLVVEWDMAFPDEEHLYRFWLEDRAPGSGESLTVMRRTQGGITIDDLWPFPNNFQITYCVGSGFTTTQRNLLLPALDEAARAWSQMVGVRHERVSVSGTCNASNTTVVFDVQRVTGAPYVASAFFPGYARSSRTLFVDDTAFSLPPTGPTLAGVMAHELGHTIGFRHEHIWVPCTGESTADARQVTAYDPMSVMHYPSCRTPPGGTQSISPLDYLGAIQLYGLAPALTMSVFHGF